MFTCPLTKAKNSASSPKIHIALSPLNTLTTQPYTSQHTASQPHKYKISSILHGPKFLSKGTFLNNIDLTLSLRRVNYQHSTTSFKHKVTTHAQIRPIVSSLNGPLYKISWLLTHLLKPLPSTFPAHVSSSDQVQDRLYGLQPQQLHLNNYIFSLNVVSLYISITAHFAINLIFNQVSSNDLYCFRITPTDIHINSSISSWTTLFSNTIINTSFANL